MLLKENVMIWTSFNCLSTGTTSGSEYGNESPGFIKGKFCKKKKGNSFYGTSEFDLTRERIRRI
jgi:hypothetical protein